MQAGFSPNAKWEKVMSAGNWLHVMRCWDKDLRHVTPPQTVKWPCELRFPCVLLLNGTRCPLTVLNTWYTESASAQRALTHAQVRENAVHFSHTQSKSRRTLHILNERHVGDVAEFANVVSVLANVSIRWLASVLPSTINRAVTLWRTFVNVWWAVVITVSTACLQFAV